ncbi:MAG: hypothetical protein HKP28_03235 [Winogradskyella sp.]|nr:hypothetical protein [Winogradskyella sp.]
MIFKFSSIALLFFISCGSSPKTTAALEKKTVSIEQLNCPDDGFCNIELLEKKKPELAFDEFNNSYLNYLDSLNSTIIFEYKKDQDPRVMDGGYREELIIPINDSLLIDGTVIDLSDHQIYYGRFCFCRGQSGYYVINDGQLTINKVSANNFSIELQFSTNEVPHVLKHIRMYLTY